MLESVGFIGLGIMGKPMARNLLAAGYQLCVYSRQQSDCKALEHSASVIAKSPQDVAQQSNVIIMMVPDTKDVEHVIFGGGGLFEALGPGKLVVDMSTISATATEEMALRIGETGAKMLDAPCSGGEKGAIDASLSIMVGGEADAFQRCLPIFRCLGSTVVHVGQSGAGQIVKACNQVLGAVIVFAMGEALALGTKAGVDPDKIVEVLSAGAARCWALENRAPHVLQRNFDAGFKTSLQYKDLRLAEELSVAVDSPLLAGALVQQFYKSAVSKGLENEDYTSIIRLIEELCGVEIRSRRR